jgi:integrase
MIQRGYIFKVGRAWYGRWRRDEVEKDAEGNSRIVRRQHCEKLADVGDRYRSEKDVRPLLDAKLRPVNEGRCTAERTLSVAEYFEKHFLPYATRELKPSTTYGYRGMWRMYLRARLEKISLGDFRCVDATNLLTAIHREHGLGRKSLRHCKGLLSSVFTHAKRGGVIDGENPVKDAGIPRAADTGQPTHAYSPQEIIGMLDVLKGVAKTAVALMYFCGLRPGEARAARWSDYDSKRKVIRIHSSMWRKLETTPKTAESIAPVPVCEYLAEILAETPSVCEFILSSPLGKPVDLHNLAFRHVVPSLSACAVCRKPRTKHATDNHDFQSLPAWRGWYACRRGAATLATQLDSPLAAKGLLRHSDLATTTKHYIKDVPAETLRAVQKIDALFASSATSI